MEGLIPFLIFLLVLAIIIVVVFYIIDLLGLPAPVPRIAKLIVGVLALIMLLSRALPMLGYGTHF